MAGTLKDLAPAEKRKVAALIRQVVDKERQVKELQAALAAERGSGGAERGRCSSRDDDDGREQAFETQNRELTRENTS